MAIDTVPLDIDAHGLISVNGPEDDRAGLLLVDLQEGGFRTPLRGHEMDG